MTVREKDGSVLHPSYVGEVGEDAERFLRGFFGLDPDVESYEIHEVYYCCICGKRVEGHPHNAAPLRDGVCCDECNYKKVIPQRLKNI